MSLLKPKAKSEKKQIRIQLETGILDEIQQYCQYAGFAKIDEFLEQASQLVFNKDKAFKAWQEKQ